MRYLIECGLMASFVKLLSAIIKIIEVMLKLVTSHGAGIFGHTTGKRGKNERSVGEGRAGRRGYHGSGIVIGEKSNEKNFVRCIKKGDT